MQARNNLFIVSPLIRKAITSGALCASSDAIANRLAALCEQFYLNRQIKQLTEAAELLVSLPGERAQAAGRYYQALVHIRQGEHERAAALLESVATSEAAPKLRARAMQSLGMIYRRENADREAARLYHQSVSLAGNDFITIIRAGMNLADILGSEGDHLKALDHLRAIQPAVKLAAQVAPVYLPLWANDVALDLAGLGRIDEARRFAALAVSSPYSRAYPEWAETAQEIEQARESKAAHKSILRAVAMPARSTARKRTPRTLFLVLKLVLKAPRRRSQPRTAIFTRELPRSRPILEQVSLKIKIRAPSF